MTARASITQAASKADGPQLVLIDAARLDAFEAKIDALAAALKAATVIPAPEWVGVKEAAKRLGVSVATIQRRVANGSMPATGAGKLKRVKVG